MLRVETLFHQLLSRERYRRSYYFLPLITNSVVQKSSNGSIVETIRFGIINLRSLFSVSGRGPLRGSCGSSYLGDATRKTAVTTLRVSSRPFLMQQPFHFTIIRGRLLPTPKNKRTCLVPNSVKPHIVYLNDIFINCFYYFSAVASPVAPFHTICTHAIVLLYTPVVNT